jgi:hypothetical protein
LKPEKPPRLPLHLLYRFDRPGTYEVRYVGYAWIAADPFKGGCRVLITGPHGFGTSIPCDTRVWIST